MKYYLLEAETFSRVVEVSDFFKAYQFILLFHFLLCKNYKSPKWELLTNFSNIQHYKYFSTNTI